jgi:hypothetical protein
VPLTDSWRRQHGLYTAFFASVGSSLGFSSGGLSAMLHKRAGLYYPLSLKSRAGLD